jgi:hypothetical protein
MRLHFRETGHLGLGPLTVRAHRLPPHRPTRIRSGEAVENGPSRHTIQPVLQWMQLVHHPATTPHRNRSRLPVQTQGHVERHASAAVPHLLTIGAGSSTRAGSHARTGSRIRGLDNPTGSACRAAAGGGPAGHAGDGHVGYWAVQRGHGRGADRHGFANTFPHGICGNS